MCVCVCVCVFVSSSYILHLFGLRFQFSIIQTRTKRPIFSSLFCLFCRLIEAVFVFLNYIIRCFLSPPNTLKFYISLQTKTSKSFASGSQRITGFLLTQTSAHIPNLVGCVILVKSLIKIISEVCHPSPELTAPADPRLCSAPVG